MPRKKVESVKKSPKKITYKQLESYVRGVVKKGDMATLTFKKIMDVSIEHFGEKNKQFINDNKAKLKVFVHSQFLQLLSKKSPRKTKKSSSSPKTKKSSSPRSKSPKKLPSPLKKSPPKQRKAKKNSHSKKPKNSPERTQITYKKAMAAYEKTNGKIKFDDFEVMLNKKFVFITGKPVLSRSKSRSPKSPVKLQFQKASPPKRKSPSPLKIKCYDEDEECEGEGKVCDIDMGDCVNVDDVGEKYNFMYKRNNKYYGFVSGDKKKIKGIRKIKKEEKKTKQYKKLSKIMIDKEGFIRRFKHPVSQEEHIEIPINDQKEESSDVETVFEKMKEYDDGDIKKINKVINDYNKDVTKVKEKLQRPVKLLSPPKKMERGISERAALEAERMRKEFRECLGVLDN